MGIGPHAIKLTRIINDARLLPKSFTVLEFGSQDFAPTLPDAQMSIRKEFGFNNVHEINVPRDLYTRMGASRYDCIDLDGYHGAHVFDLNLNIRREYGFKDQFDIVTNHGTTEHLLNQLMVFQNVHELTAVNGVMVHALPFQGYQNHGMFNYNPSLFLDLAVANGYKVFGIFVSVDDRLYAYDEDFLARNKIASAQDTLLLVVLIKQNDKKFQVPYDGRYFAVHGRGEVQALAQHVGTTRRSFGVGFQDITGLDEFEQEYERSTHRYRLITPIWGRDYVDAYLNVTLPSQLGAGNLHAFGPKQAVYTIVTTPEDSVRISRSPVYEELTALMDVEIIYLDGSSHEHSYSRMSRAYNVALERVQSPQVCFFLTADDFYSDGLFQTAISAVEAGKKVVMVPTIRVVAESFRAELSINEIKAAKPRDLVGMMLRHEHPMITACVVNDESRTIHRLPSQTIYRTSTGYVGRWNVMHPLVVSVTANPKPVLATVDWNYPALHVTGDKDICILFDSDEGSIASLTPYTYSQQEEIATGATKRRRIANLKNWVDIDWALGFHVLQMENHVYIHTSDVDGAEWQRGASVVDSVWKPFRRYIERRRVKLPSGTRGHTLALMTRAVKPDRLRELYRLAGRARSRVWKKGTARIKNLAMRLVK